MTHVVITGFRAFPGVPDNPSQHLVEHLARTPGALPDESVCELLDVEYGTVGEAVERLLDGKPRALVMTGYSRHVAAITLESCAHGHCATDQPDAAGHVHVVANDERVRETDIDLTALAQVLEGEGIVARLSRDAGAYVCNYTYRRALDGIAERNGKTSALFVHIPAIEGSDAARESEGALSLDLMTRAIGIVARELARS